ncbi:ATP-binding cassette domain-containing protein [Nonomuraea sp. NPDC050783]|uniref:ATP-binding cassette domain-containing protein n=1 Tax=Nonomuraea sp. NPDC050783 TaxID=3154634 RepID=UPI0034672893
MSAAREDRTDVTNQTNQTDPAAPPGFWRALRRDPRALARIGLWSVLEAGPAFLIGHAVARAIEDGFAAGAPATGLAWLAGLGLTWLVAAVAARQVVLAVAAVAEPFRDDLLAYVVRGVLRRGPFADGSAVDGSAVDGAADGGAADGSAAVARAGLQVELARDAFAAVVTTVRGFAFTVVSVVLGLSTLAPRTLVLVLPPFVAGLGLFLVSLPALARRQRAFLLADERLAEEMTATAGGLRDIEACGLRDRVAARLAGRTAEQAAAARALARVTGVRTAALAVGSWLPVLLLLAGTPWLLSSGAGAGVVVGALAYVTQSLAPALSGLVQGIGVSGVRLAAALRRIAAATPPSGPEPARVRPPTGELRLRGVAFSYGPGSAPVLDGLDLTVPEGDHLAVVGPSGAGKSTLALLIAGLLRPGAGEVLIGGVPAERAEHAARALIPQEAYVFRGTVLENLTYLRPSAEPAEIDASVAAIGARELVDALGGYAAELDPAALSAGQRQLLALVRAHLSPAPLVILDEATCHLDPAAEARAELAFARRGGTLIVIAHRLTSALRARRILLMDGGQTLIGTHDALVESSPLYADLAGHWHPEPVS